MALDLATLLVIVALMTRIHSHPEPKAQEFFANVQTLSYQILTEPQDASETKLLAQSIASDLKNGFIATIAKLSKIVIVHNISGGFCGLEKNNQYGEALDKLGKL